MAQDCLAQRGRVRDCGARERDRAAKGDGLWPQMQTENVPWQDEVENLPTPVRQEPLPAGPAGNQQLWRIQELAFGDQFGSR